MKRIDETDEPGETLSPLARKRRSKLFLILAGILTTNAVLAEIIGVKIFSGEAMFGLPPVGWVFFGQQVAFNLTAGALIWPVVFVTSDVVNEYYGRPGVRRISLMASGLIVYAFVVLWLATQLPPASFWLEVNRNSGGRSDFDINHAFGTVFRQGLGIIAGSITAFLVAQLLDAWVFHKVRQATGEKYIWLRATGSTLVSQLVDSFVVLLIAFYLFGNWPFVQVLAVASLNYVYKAVVAFLLTPVLYLAHAVIDRYLGKKAAAQVLTEAAVNG
jgi:queuosine precursor transporter